jgi:hypothetical protein
VPLAAGWLLVHALAERGRARGGALPLSRGTVLGHEYGAVLDGAATAALLVKGSMKNT